MKVSNVAVFLLAASVCLAARADDKAQFDLTGPKVEVRVSRHGTTLPIAEVPNLQPGDKLWVRADLPANQSNHLLLIVAFLRGTTNEPPDNWFTEIDTWDKKTQQEGTSVTVPDAAQQALLFIAPQTGGDFKTLRSAVKGRPGLFIRADTDLNEASFEQQRIERYLSAIKAVANADQKTIQEHSAKLAATLDLKPNADCFKRPVEQQVTCLTQTSAPVLLSDGHGESIAAALSTGPASDFINTASLTQTAGAGVYSAYVGTVIDLVHIVSLMRTAQYQYIPGLSFPEKDTLDLKLNTPPSFINPKTVIVIGLPAIQSAKPPPLKPQNPDEVACLLDPKMALQLEGAPLVFSTSFARDLVLHLNRTGAPTDLPLTPDAFEGGLVVDKSQSQKRETLQDASARAADDKAAAGTKIGSASDVLITGTVHGYWGFDPFTGPTLTLQQVDGTGWKVVGVAQLFAGKDNKLTLQADAIGCVKHIALTDTKPDKKDKDVDVAFKAAAGKDSHTTLDLTASLQQVQPGGDSLAIQQFGTASEDHVALTAYNPDIKFASLKLHAGDNTAQLTGQGVAEVAAVQIGNQNFTPGAPTDGKTLDLRAKSGVSPANGSEAKVKLKDGRTLTVKVTTEAALPSVKLLSFHATPAQPPGSLPIMLGAKDDIPLAGKLTFVVQSQSAFPRAQTIEVATAGEVVHTSLSLAANDLVLQDEHTAVATLDPLKAFGESAFGKLGIRPVAPDGSGSWIPLGTLVRTPDIKAVKCTTAAAPSCTVSGSNLFLAQAFCAAANCAKPAEVPTGFAAGSFTVPTPADGKTLYIKLRDDPSAAATLSLPTPVPQPAPAAAAPAPAAPAPAAAATPASAGKPAPAPASSAATTPSSTPASKAAPSAMAPKPTAPAPTQPAAPAPSAATPAQPTPGQPTPGPPS
jgi:hypothetical protein